MYDKLFCDFGVFDTQYDHSLNSLCMVVKPGSEPFEYYFLDAAFNGLYQAEERHATFFKYFTMLATPIACLGLFGLVTFTTERRRKEIGIRTILGASMTSVLSLISKEFIWIVIPGVLVATPLAWLSMDMWLSSFPYRITLSALMFVTGGLVVMALALSPSGFRLRRLPVQTL